MKESKNIYEKSYFIDMKSGEKEYKKQEKKQQKKKSYLTGQLINMLIIIVVVLVILIFLVFFYKPNIIDYLEETKRTFTYGMIILLGMMIVFMIAFNILLKDKRMLSNLLKIVLFFNIVCLILFFYIEAILDSTYNNEENFGNVYDERIDNKTDTEYVDIWKSLLEQQLHTKTEKEVFVEENIKQFQYFKIRVYLIFILYVITMMVNTYMISKIERYIKAKEILEKNDTILFKNKINMKEER